MPSEKSLPGKVNRRKEILRATEKLMLSHGLSGVTTRRISREVGCSDAALYAHFKGRLELLLAMLEERLPEMLGPLRDLQRQVGRSSPQSNLVTTMRGVYRFHQRATPLLAGLFAEPELHAAYRASLSSRGKGPHLSMKAIEEYIAAEQELGRIDEQVDAWQVANILLSCSFFHAFSEQFFGGAMQPSWGRYVKELVAAVAPERAT